MSEVHHYEFEEALKLIKSGQLMAREGWNGKGMYVFLVSGSNFEVNRPPLLTYRPHIDMKYADGTVGVWLASMGDLLANDWVVVQK